MQCTMRNVLFRVRERERKRSSRTKARKFYGHLYNGMQFYYIKALSLFLCAMLSCSFSISIDVPDNLNVLKIVNRFVASFTFFPLLPIDLYWMQCVCTWPFFASCIYIERERERLCNKELFIECVFFSLHLLDSFFLMSSVVFVVIADAFYYHSKCTLPFFLSSFWPDF